MDQETTPPELPDPRPAFAHVVSTTGDLIAATTDQQLRLSTPCPDYDVELLTAHLVAVLRRVAAVARGEDPFSVPQEAPAPTDGTWHDAWMAAAHEVQDAWTDPAVLGTDLTLPFGVFPGAMALTFYVAEVAVHAWDLATATARTVVFDDAQLGPALMGVKMGIPAEGRGADMPFDPVVEVPDTAPAVDQMAGWMGRQAG